MLSRNDRKSFSKFPPHHRPHAYWMINDRLDEKELVRQFDALLDGGLGGVILHADDRLPKEDYGTPSWFDALSALLKRARKRNARLIVHNEHGGPTASAPGLIARDHPDWGMRYLTMDDVRITEKNAEDDLLDSAVAAFTVQRDDPGQGVHRNGHGAVALSPDRPRILPVIYDFDPREWLGGRLLVFRETQSREHFNYLSAAPTREYIEQAHEPYYKNLRRHFGHAFSHICSTDVELSPGPAELPWDHEFDALFQETRGYSLLPYLPALFFDVADCEKVRYDYWTMIAEMLREGFAAPMASWSAEHRLPSTGRYAYQPSLKETVPQLGSIMPLYAHQDLPGIDLRGTDIYSRRINEFLYCQSVVAIKQVVSVARQLGKEGALTECFAMAGHGLSIEDMHSSALFQLALGITDLVYHGVFYSLRGDRKLDTSPILGPPQPYWKVMDNHLEAVGRGAWLMTRGESRVDLLVLHPASSMQAAYRHARTEEECSVQRADSISAMPFEVIDRHFALLSAALLDAHLDFDYADEEILAGHGRAEEKQIVAGGQRYSAMLLPPMLNIRSTTLELLKDFTIAGGHLFALGSAIRLVDGQPSDEAAEFIQQYGTRIVDGIEHYDYGDVLEKLVAAIGPTILVHAEEPEPLRGLKMQRRTWGDKEIYYIANVSQETVRGEIEFDAMIDGALEEWDISSGETSPIGPLSDDAPTSYAASWAPRQVHVYVASPMKKVRAIPEPNWVHNRTLPLHWQGRRVDSNTLPLVQCSLEGEELVSISQAREGLFKRVTRAGSEVRVTTRWPFEVSPIIPWTEACHMTIELPNEAEVRLNSDPLYLDLQSDTMDPSMSTVNLPELKLGRNLLEVSGTYSNAWNLESPWIHGDFRVASEDNKSFQIEFGAGQVTFGAWSSLGFPFYAGSFVYQTVAENIPIDKNERIVLNLGELKGSAEVRLNGAIVKRVLYPPYEIDLTEVWKGDKCVVEIEVFSTLRNLMGPHFDENEDRRAGFYRAAYEGQPGDTFHFREYGLMNPPELVIERHDS